MPTNKQFARMTYECPVCHRFIGGYATIKLVRHRNFDGQMCAGSTRPTDGLPIKMREFVDRQREDIEISKKALQKQPFDAVLNAFECPLCKRYIGNNGQCLNWHNSAVRVKCDGTGLSVEGLPGRPRTYTERVRDMRKRRMPGTVNYELRKAEGSTRAVRVTLDEGLCEVCRTWHHMTLRGTVWRHGTNLRCPGGEKAPTKIRPRGAWKRRSPKRGNDVEATNQST